VVGLLPDARAVVTGGGSGIGRATARRMAEEGAAVAVLDLDGDAAREVATEVGGLAYAVDVRCAEEVERTFADAATRLGGLTAVFNNAGIGTMSPLEGHPLEEWRRVVDVNLHGVFHCMRAAIPLMAGGSIVSTASVSGVRPSAGEAPYAAAKAGVAALTASAALELAPAIRVNAVSPGMIRTGLTDPLLAIPGHEDGMVGKTPLGRVGEPEDIADVVVFLCSPLARFVTGQNLVVDGGMLLHGAGVDGLMEQFLGPASERHTPGSAA
jgi:NAD(P)-dependent dehydrogenase (short-subunit alcohol dehydrogenase family)